MDQLPRIWMFFSCILLHYVIAMEASAANESDLKDRVKAMFYHAYNGYIKYAYPLDELRPLTCDGHDTWGSFSLTLVDALDTLAIMGNWSEFNRACRMLLDHLDSNRNVNVSVFETNIRVVGGLISAHLFSRRAGFQVEPTWPCSGPLLRQAVLFARKLLPAFDTPTGMPYGTVNLALNAVPPNETSVTCVAGIGTLILEFGTLSRLTGDPQFEAVAMRALRALWTYRSSKGLLGNHIDVLTGRWIASDATIGGAVDSFFEYLVKGAVLFRFPELDAMFREYKKAIDTHLKHGDWHLVVNKDHAHVTHPVFQGLDAFWPGILSLTGDLDGALRHVTAYHEVWKQYGFIPESYNVLTSQVTSSGRSYHLRPEFIESVYYLYRATRDPMLIQMGNDVLTSIEQVARTACGYATVLDVTTHKLDNRMESFFLSETTKYLYLLFDEKNFVNELPGDGHFSRHLSPSGNECITEMGGYVFNTEAHPIDPGALDCCFVRDTDIRMVDGDETLTADADIKSKMESLYALEQQLNPMEDLLLLIDAVFEPHVSAPTTLTSGIIPPMPQVAGACTKDDLFIYEITNTWMELRSLALDVLSQNVSTTNPLDSASLPDLDLFRPPLLTCPYPPFHQRYTIAKELVTSTGSSDRSQTV